jgi:curli biogenesis system outer membrane secretion channel CsgG
LTARDNRDSPIVPRMKTLLAIVAIGALAGCGVETASTAATAVEIKKQELEQGQRNMERAQQKIDAAVGQMQQRAASAADDSK